MKYKKISIKKLVSYLYEVGTLRKIARSHRQTLYTDDLSDNIAGHSYRVTMIGYLLAMMEDADTSKVIKMCLLHDTDETRSNDQNWIHKKYVKVFEHEIQKDQLQFLGKNNELVKIKDEYNKRETLESKIAKDADMLDQVLILREHEWSGNKEAGRWLKGKTKFLTTKSAIKIREELKKQRPSLWWDNIWTSKRR